ncbi:unnamed protein product [Dovyalis caffra]|uniref:Uncharacterized protein n=1 Tax=Dovyalis caffra TaxID=77055 RepID=A0AAV1QQ98_9ROSI|nr:unnamed protein product [Dovyalis caffra]
MRFPFEVDLQREQDFSIGVNSKVFPIGLMNVGVEEESMPNSLLASLLGDDKAATIDHKIYKGDSPAPMTKDANLADELSRGAIGALWVALTSLEGLRS